MEKSVERITGKHGFFRVAQQAEMPVGVSEITISEYVMPGKLGKAEQEEAAARLITACQEAEEWCGVSLNKLIEKEKKEFKFFADFHKEYTRYWHAYMDWRYNMCWFILFCLLTFGIYSIFVKIPQKPIKPEKPDFSFFCSFAFGGPCFVMQGLAELYELGLVTIIKQSQEEIIFPTVKLIEAIK